MAQRQLMCHLKLPGCDPLNEVPLPKGCPSLPPIEDGIVTAAHRRAISTTSICKVDQEGNVIALRTCQVVTWPQLFLIGESHHLTARDIFLAGMFMEKLLSCRQRAWKGAERKIVDPLLKDHRRAPRKKSLRQSERDYGTCWMQDANWADYNKCSHRVTSEHRGWEWSSPGYGTRWRSPWDWSSADWTETSKAQWEQPQSAPAAGSHWRYNAAECSQRKSYK